MNICKNGVNIYNVIFVSLYWGNFRISFSAQKRKQGCSQLSYLCPFKPLAFNFSASRQIGSRKALPVAVCTKGSISGCVSCGFCLSKYTLPYTKISCHSQLLSAPNVRLGTSTVQVLPVLSCTYPINRLPLPSPTISNSINLPATCMYSVVE